jgi:hypothetical protein
VVAAVVVVSPTTDWVHHNHVEVAFLEDNLDMRILEVETCVVEEDGIQQARRTAEGDIDSWDIPVEEAVDIDALEGRGEIVATAEEVQ